MKAPTAGPSVSLPLLPLSDAVLLPMGVVRVHVPAGWSAGTALVEHLTRQEGTDVLVAAVPLLPSAGGGGAVAAAAAPGEEDGLDLSRLFHTGTVARVVQLSRQPQAGRGGWAVTLEGRARLAVREVAPAGLHRSSGALLLASGHQLDYLPAPQQQPEGGEGGEGEREEEERLQRAVLAGLRRLFLLVGGGRRNEGRDAAARVTRMLKAQGPARCGDVVGSLVARDPRDRLAVLAAAGVRPRLALVLGLLQRLLEVAEGAAAGGGGLAGGGGGSPVVRGSPASSGLRRQRRPGRSEGQADDAEEGDEDEEGQEEGGARAELAAVMRRLAEARPPPEVMRAAAREARRLGRGSEQQPGWAMSLTYLETLADLPWSRWASRAAAPGLEGGGAQAGPPRGAVGAADLSLAGVRAALDRAHYGLDKVKERIVQYVAVQQLRGWDARAPILAFIGPPGVGKTSLARSVADVLGRPFQRISLGGVRDEAEVRGHRRTYIGAMPGRVIQAVRRAGVKDGVLLLDEVDKMGRDARGDPAAALLEVLDPEQNSAFTDTYLGLPFDLSGVLFVATANRAPDIPPALLDRLEVVVLPGYSREERVRIAAEHLLPAALAEHGIPPGALRFPEPTLRALTEGWTREAGVRSLSRALAAVCRHAAVRLVAGREEAEEAAAAAAAATGGVAGVEAPGPLPLELPGFDGGSAPSEAPGPGEDGDLGSWGGSRGRRGGGRALAGTAQPQLDDWLAAEVWAAAEGPAAGTAAEEELRELLAPLALSVRQGAAEASVGIAGGSGEPSPQRPQQQEQQQEQPGWRFWRGWGRPHDGEAQQPQQQQQPGGSGGWEAAAEARHCGRPTATLSLLGPGSMGLLAGSTQHPTHLQSPQPQQQQQQWGSEPAAPAAIVVDLALLEEVLGPPPFSTHDAAERVAAPGAAAGLVWTSVGGQLQYIECIRVGPGKAGQAGALTLTGQLGDVLEESARIALSWVRAHAEALGLAAGVAAEADIHIHLPAGGVPKDGPSAGVTLATALVSLLSGRSVRGDTAMTGELSLRGLVLPVGGVKEKLLAALAAGMGRVLLPQRNMRDVVAEVPAGVRAELELVPCGSLEEVLAAAFDPPLLLPRPPPLARL